MRYKDIIIHRNTLTSLIMKAQQTNYITHSFLLYAFEIIYRKQLLDEKSLEPIFTLFINTITEAALEKPIKFKGKQKQKSIIELQLEEEEKQKKLTSQCLILVSFTHSLQFLCREFCQHYPSLLQHSFTSLQQMTQALLSEDCILAACRTLRRKCRYNLIVLVDMIHYSIETPL